MKTAQLAILTAAIVLTLASCGGGGDADAGRKTYNYEKADSLSKDYLRELGSVRVSIEQSAKLYKHLNANGVSFDNSIMTPTSKSFGSSKQQAIGLGMFASAMTYATTYGQAQVAADYLKGVFDQANKLGISEAFDQALLEKLSSDDTTINKSILLTKAYLKATDQLYSEERAQLVTMMVFGGWLEGLSISLKAVGNKAGDQETNLGIFDQVMTYNNTLKMLSVFKDENAEVKEIHDAMVAIGPQVKTVLGSRGNLNEQMLVDLTAALDGLKSKFL